MAIPRLDTSFIGVLLLLTVLEHNRVESIICYSCQQMAHPDECTNVKTCDQNQVCVVESTKDDNGNVTYKSGCINKQSCGYLVPPRSNRRRQGQVTEQCKLCCGEDFCNYDLCDHGRQVHLGPTCLHCDYVQDIHQCNNLTRCAKEEICFAQQYITRGFKLGCIEEKNCRLKTTAQIVGKRSDQSSGCRECCHGDHCNYGLCNGHSPEFELMVDAIHPVHPNCQDGSHRDCQDLLTKFGASCQNPGIAQLCPQSCGKCVDDSSCMDNATFNCAEVGRSFSICDDVDAARKYCRRYCGDCNFVNGGWSSWSHWSDCDSPCGYGSQTRLRKCSNPPPTKLGHRCTGSFQESRFCLSSFYCASRYRYVFPLIQNFAKDRHHRNIELLICADDVVTINVSIPLNPGAEREMVLHAGLNVVNFSLGLIPEDFKKEHKAVEIKSRDPVAAYVLNYEEYSSDVFYIYEARDLSTEYILTMLQSYSVHNRSMATIAALNDNTLVNVTFQLNGGSEVISVNKRTYSSGDSLIIKLDRLQEYEITYNGDLTGTHITSNQNLAVTSGNECLQIGAGSCSHSSEMTIPLSKYGTKYIVPMVFNRTIVTAQIISGFDSNNVTIRGRKSVTNLTLGKGQFKNLEFSEPVFIRSEKGISVSIFVHGRSDHQGDPFMMSVPSIDHYQPDYHFPVPSGYSSYATVIMEDKYDGNLLLDKHGIPPFLTAFEVLHDLKRYLVFTINVSTGAHRLEHTHGAVFGLFIHGDRYGDGYGYMAGHNKLN